MKPPDPIVVALERHARLRPAHVAVRSADGPAAITYGELWRRAVVGASELKSLGVQPADTVVIVAESTPEFAVAYFAVHLARAVAVPIDPTAPVPRVQGLANRARSRLILSDRELPGGAGPGVRIHPVRGLGAAGVEDAAEHPHPADTADLLFTSGTGGVAKGVALTHANIASAATQINAVIGNTAADVEVVPLPLNHSFGLTRLRCTVLTGGTVVLCSGFRLPGGILSALETNSATGLVGVPAGFAILLRFGTEGFASFSERLRYIEIGSAPMPKEHKELLMTALPTTAIWMHYGLTEASRSAFIEFHRHRDRLDTVGRLTPGVEASVRDGLRRDLPVGEVGTLWLRGPSVASAYWDDDSLSAARFVDGWLDTGDLAAIDANGFITLHGRADDLINVGGFNVAPEEVEAALELHPAVSEAACVAATDRRGLGSVVAAYLVASPSADRPADRELAEWVAARLESYKVPARFVWIAALPRTESGKVRRTALRDGDAAGARSHNPDARGR